MSALPPKADIAAGHMGSAGIGTPQHVIGELFKMMTGVNMVHVPYHGAAPELTDLIAGQVQVSFDPIQGSIGYIKGGMLRPLAVTTTTRTDALPNVPTVGEFVPAFEARTWQGLGAPAGTPAKIVEILNKDVNDILADPRLRARFADLGIIPMPMTPAECQRFITAETEKWAKVIKFAGIKPGMNVWHSLIAPEISNSVRCPLIRFVPLADMQLETRSDLERY